MVSGLITEVFKTVGKPEITYVERDSGALEVRLDRALSENGQLCLITGPSKTGKTTLYTEVLNKRGERPLVVRCDIGLTLPEIWKQALERIDFDRVEARSNTITTSKLVNAEVGGNIGWSWLAGLALKGSIKADKCSSDVESRRQILSEPNSDHLIPVLQSLKYVLVLEDFHYLTNEVQILLFQQWKRFVDSEVSVIVVGTSHKAITIANSNKDLIGRITQIDVSQWNIGDLISIAKKGFTFLGSEITLSKLDLLAKECVGLPIVMQQICLELLSQREIQKYPISKKQKNPFTSQEVRMAMHIVAKLRYYAMEDWYQTFIRGPREKARKYKTYELIVACFTLDPIKFNLTRHEIGLRLDRMKLPESQHPPSPSVNSTLSALHKFQIKRKLEILEWVQDSGKLYMLEPIFLYYIRWREPPRDNEPIQLDLFSEIIKSFKISLGSGHVTVNLRRRNVDLAE
jgi:hypothetical protein